MLLTEDTKETLAQEKRKALRKRQQKTCKCGRKTYDRTGICAECMCEQCGL